MKHQAQKLEKFIQGACVGALVLAATVLTFIFVGMYVHEIRHHKPGDNEWVIGGAMATIASLAFFSGYSGWRLWRGSLSANGVTLMPTWFIEAFGVFVLVLIAYTAYSYPTWWLLAFGAVVGAGVLNYRRSLSETRKRNGRISD